MIKLSNGREIEFLCASGALGWAGECWWWERPLLALGLIRPDEITVIGKTLTLNPLAGNLKMWCPWRCVRLIPEGGAVNAVGLTNMGLAKWIEERYPYAVKRGLNLIASIMPKTPEEAAVMARMLAPLKLAATEINLSCPNVEHDGDIGKAVEICGAVAANCPHPVIVKLGVQDDYVACAKALADAPLARKVEAIELINTVPWKRLFPDQPSPLAKYGLEGGVSGPPIIYQARRAIRDVRSAGISIPIISGGGIDSVNEVYVRHEMGADAFAIGTLFLRRPWEPRGIVRECRAGLSARELFRRASQCK